MLALHPTVVDAVWTTIEALVPNQPPDTHPLGWDVAAGIVHVGKTTLRRRRDQWVRAGLLGVLAREALEACDRVIGLDLCDVAIAGSQHQAPGGGKAPARTPPTGADWDGRGRSPPTETA